MTNKELIEELSKYPPDAETDIFNIPESKIMNILTVNYSPDWREITLTCIYQ